MKTYAKVPLPPEIKARKEVLDRLKQMKKQAGTKLKKPEVKRHDMYTIMESQEPAVKTNLNSPRKTKDWGALEKKNKDPMNDTSYIRRMKKANYGKWYMNPDDYNNKAEFITQQMLKQKQMMAGEIDD